MTIFHVIKYGNNPVHDNLPLEVYGDLIRWCRGDGTRIFNQIGVSDYIEAKNIKCRELLLAYEGPL